MPAVAFLLFATVVSLSSPQCEPYTVELQNPIELGPDATTHTLTATLDVEMRTVQVISAAAPAPTPR